MNLAVPSLYTRKQFWNILGMSFGSEHIARKADCNVPNDLQIFIPKLKSSPKMTLSE